MKKKQQKISESTVYDKLLETVYDKMPNSGSYIKPREGVDLVFNGQNPFDGFHPNNGLVVPTGVAMESLKDKLVDGTFYRVDGGLSNKHLTAQDVVDFEADEHGNEDVRDQAKETGIDLTKYNGDDVIWVTKSKRDALRYGNRAEISEYKLKGIILAEDGDGGYLILKDDKIEEYMGQSYAGCDLVNAPYNTIRRLPPLYSYMRSVEIYEKSGTKFDKNKINSNMKKNDKKLPPVKKFIKESLGLDEAKSKGMWVAKTSYHHSSSQRSMTCKTTSDDYATALAEAIVDALDGEKGIDASKHKDKLINFFSGKGGEMTINCGFEGEGDDGDKVDITVWAQNNDEVEQTGFKFNNVGFGEGKNLSDTSKYDNIWIEMTKKLAKDIKKDKRYKKLSGMEKDDLISLIINNDINV